MLAELQFLISLGSFARMARHRQVHSAGAGAKKKAVDWTEKKGSGSDGEKKAVDFDGEKSGCGDGGGSPCGSGGKRDDRQPPSE